MEKDTIIASNSEMKSVQNGESQKEDAVHGGHGKTAQQETNNNKVTTKVNPDSSAHPVVLGVEKDSNHSAAPGVTDVKTKADKSTASVTSRKTGQLKDVVGEDVKESTTSEAGKGNRRQAKPEPRTETPSKEQNTNATLTAGKKRRQTEVKMEAKPENPDEGVTSSEAPATKKRVGRPKKEQSEPSGSKTQHNNSDKITENTEGETKKKEPGKKVVKEESSSQSKETNTESAVLNSKRQRSRQKMEDELSPKKPEDENKDTQIIAEPDKKRGRGNKTEANKDSGVLDPAEPEKKKGRGIKTETHIDTVVQDPAEPEKKKGRGMKTETHIDAVVQDPAEPEKKRARGNKNENHKDTEMDEPAEPEKKRGRGNKAETHKDTKVENPVEPEMKKGRGNKSETHKAAGMEDQVEQDKKRGRGNKTETHKDAGVQDPVEPEKKKGRGYKTETHKDTGVEVQAEPEKKRGKGNKNENHKDTEMDEPAEPEKKKGRGGKTKIHKETGVDEPAEPEKKRGRGNKTETHKDTVVQDQAEPEKKKGRGNKTETHKDTRVEDQVEPEKKKGRGGKTETHKDTVVEDPAPKVKMGKNQKQAAEGHRTSKWEKNIAKYKWANSAKDKYVGAHVSITGGLYKAVLEAEELGARAFGLFLRSQRQWASKPLEDAVAQRFKDTCKEYGYSPHVIVPHGSYLMNCGSPDDASLQKSRDLLLEELQRCEKLGLNRFNFHPGSTCGKISVEECLDRIGESINQALAKTKGVTAVIENMCCQGSTVGGKFEELKGIISRVHDKSRIGVCLDTCHMFAAGYDISTEKGYQNMMEEFNRIVGQKYLKALHLNDSKGEVGSHLDRHENIGKGLIGKAAFQRIMNDARLNNIPMILETPCDEDETYEEEVRILYSMCK